ncbi:MAG: GxxExxY protein [Bacteroidales bacterium]|nr:GxxExxY protein [Bacteroidales bacterium]
MGEYVDISKCKDVVYQIIGSAMTVHRELGGGLLEPVYNDALHLELLDKGIDNQSEVSIECFYKHHKLEKHYRMDIVVGDIIVELKATDMIIPEFRLQLFNYLRLTRKTIGLLLNFSNDSLYGERYFYNRNTNECVLIDKSMEPVPR